MGIKYEDVPKPGRSDKAAIPKVGSNAAKLDSPTDQPPGPGTSIPGPIASKTKPKK